MLSRLPLSWVTRQVAEPEVTSRFRLALTSFGPAAVRLSPAPLSSDPSGPNCCASVFPSDAKLISAVPLMPVIVPLAEEYEFRRIPVAVASTLVIVTGPSVRFVATIVTCWKSLLGHLRQEREAADGHIRLLREPLLLDLGSQDVLSHGPGGEVQHYQQRDDNGRDDQVPAGAPTAARGAAACCGSPFRSLRVPHQPDATASGGMSRWPPNRGFWRRRAHWPGGHSHGRSPALMAAKIMSALNSAEPPNPGVSSLTASPARPDAHASFWR